MVAIRSAPEVSSAYDRVAAQYDAEYGDPVCLSENAVVADSIKALDIGGSILDLGCGTGRFCQPLAEALDATVIRCRAIKRDARDCRTGNQASKGRVYGRLG